VQIQKRAHFARRIVRDADLQLLEFLLNDVERGG
jgi:hypothetical protein